MALAKVRGPGPPCRHTVVAGGIPWFPRMLPGVSGISVVEKRSAPGSYPEAQETTNLLGGDLDVPYTGIRFTVGTTGFTVD